MNHTFLCEQAPGQDDETGPAMRVQVNLSGDLTKEQLIESFTGYLRACGHELRLLQETPELTVELAPWGISPSIDQQHPYHIYTGDQAPGPLETTCQEPISLTDGVPK